MYRFIGVLLAGSFTLAAVPVAAQSVIRPGDTVQGTLSQTDRVLDDDSFYDCFNLEARAGEHLEVTLRSNDFDAYLTVVRRADCPVGDDAESDDDGAGGTDSRVRINTGPGRYSIRANSLQAAETGRYTLSVERVAAGSAW